MQKNNTNSSPDGNSVDCNRPGGRNGPLASGSSRSWPIYAAHGQCDHGSDSNAWIAFDRSGDFVLDEEYVYESEPLPRNLDIAEHGRAQSRHE